MTETGVRLAIFAGVLLAMALCEIAAPWRTQDRAGRWPGNLGIVVLDAVMVRLIFPVTAAGLAVLAEAKGWGLFNMLGAPGWLAVPASIVLLDLAIYLQHVAFHHIPMLWRVHRMHHADREIDVTTGLRFHPIEIVLSMGIKFGVVIGLGAPPLAVIAFEILLNATAMFNHANIVLPAALDRTLRLVLVTPDMHRVHHSVVRHETDSNFGFNLPWWDRLFGTYRARPEAGLDGVDIGIGLFRNGDEKRLDKMLTQPFRER